MSSSASQDLARENLLHGQIRSWHVHDPSVLAAMRTLPREDFVAEPWKGHALADANLPLGHGECTMLPRIEARILQAMALAGGEKVLEIGTGCGYLTALMTPLADRIDSYEWHRDISEAARASFAKHGLDNINVMVGDGLAPPDNGDTWDAIVIGGAVRRSEDYAHLEARLSPGGRMLVIIGTELLQEGMLLTKGPGGLRTEPGLFYCRLPMLNGITKERKFAF